MTKKPSLAAALQVASKSTTSEMRPKPVSEPSTAIQRISKPKSRTGKRMVSGHFDSAVVRQLKQLALDHDSTVQALLGEAINELFIKHNRKPIA
jgi:hypothetical protein